MQDQYGQSTLETMANARRYNDWLYGLISPWIKGVVGDVGAGIGNFLQMYKKDNFSVTAIDYNDSYLKKIRDSHPEVKTFLFDLQSKSTPAGLLSSFDSVVSLNVLEHVPDISKALENIKSMLKPQGNAIILVPAFNFAYSSLDKNLGHIKRYTKKDLRYLINRAGLKEITSFYTNPIGLVGWFVFGKILKFPTIPKKSVSIFDWIFSPVLFIEKVIHPPFGLSLILVAQKP